MFWRGSIIGVPVAVPMPMWAVLCQLSMAVENVTRGVPEVGQLSCRVVVFMDQAAEDITAAELLGDQRLRLAIAF